MITYEDILAGMRREQRNGNWKRLPRLEKVLYRAALWYARVQGAIMNETLVGMLAVLVAHGYLT